MQAQAAGAAAHFRDYTPLPESLVVNERIVFQKIYLQYLQALGYKAGLTSSVAQRDFATEQPVPGVLVKGV